MNRIARDIMFIASELLPRIKATFTRTPKTEDKDLNLIHFAIQGFISTLRKNEELECVLSRKDDDKMMEIVIGFTDHEAMQGIITSIKELMQKQSRKFDVKAKIEVFDKN